MLPRERAREPPCRETGLRHLRDQGQDRVGRPDAHGSDLRGLPQTVVASAVGHGLVLKLQALGRRDVRRRRRLPLPGEDVEHHIGTAGAAVERLGTGRPRPPQARPAEPPPGSSRTVGPPSSRAASRVRRRPRESGSFQSLKGAPLRSAPGLRSRIGT